MALECIRFLFRLETLFDGVTYKTHGQFANNEQNVRSYYISNHAIRNLLFHYYSFFILLASSFLNFGRAYLSIVLIT